MRVDPLLGHTVAQPDGDFVIAEWTDPGCPAEGPMPVAPLHRHLECDEAWYVLEGRLTVQVDGEDLTIGPGGCVLSPKGTAHTYWNPDPTPCRYLLVMTPKTKALIDAIHAMEERSWPKLKALFAEHAAELL